MDETERARLQQIATDAQVGHWPPHLGLNTDAERIEFLADGLLKVIDECNRLDSEDNETIEAIKNQVAELAENIRHA